MSETTNEVEAPAEESPAAEAEVVPGEEALGDPGKKALDAMKAERNQFRDELRSMKAEFEAFKAKAEGREAEFTAAQEAQRVKDEAIAAANEKILRAEVKAAAKGVLADAGDAFKFLDLSGFEVGPDGDVDAEAISAALNDLIAQKPYLAAQSGPRFQGAADGGARNGGTKPSQLTQADLARMTPEEIVAAKKEGRLNDLMGINR